MGVNSKGHVVAKANIVPPTLLRVRSPYVVAIRDVVIEGSTFAIVMDYVNGGGPRGLVRAHRPGAVSAGSPPRLGRELSRTLAGLMSRWITPAR